MPDKKISQIPDAENANIGANCRVTGIDENGNNANFSLYQIITIAGGIIFGPVPVTSSRDFLASDKGKILSLGSGVILTIPSGSILNPGENIAIITGNSNAGFQAAFGGPTIYPAVGAVQSELVILSAYDSGGQTGFLLLGTAVQTDAGDSNKAKTVARYMFDNI